MSPPRSDALRRALRELAEADAVEIVALAREGARTRAQKLVEDAMLEELLDAVTRRSGERHEHGATVNDEPAGGGQAWWTYCVLSAEDAGHPLPQLAGVEPDGAVQVVREGELAALVSAVPTAEYDDLRLREHLEDLGWVERTARRHEAVLETALEQVTILPLRLCTIYRDLGGVHRLLREQAAAFLHGLRRIDGSAEWGVKVFAGEHGTGDGEAPSPAAATEQGPAPDRQGAMSPAPDRPGAAEPSPNRPGANYLMHRQRERERAGRASEFRVACAEAVHERVSRCSREAITNPPQRPELHGRELAMILNGAYLVDRDRERELYETVAAVQAEWATHGFVIELTGPWPAYNFVSETTGIVP